MMMKKAILTVGVLASAIAANAQKVCATDEFYNEQKAQFAGIEMQEAKLKAAIDRANHGRIHSAAAKTTAEEDLPWDQDTRQFHIPVVVHVIYDYASNESTPGGNNVSDAQIDASVAQMNAYFNARAQNLGGIIAPFVPYIGNARINFHLATKDPSGRPTRGIVRTYSYQASGGDEAAKINPWSPDKYLNIYLTYRIGRGTNVGIVLAYATFPTSYAQNPYSQGVISRVDQVSNTLSSTLAHEVGHYLFLYHPWNNNNAGVEAGPCGDDEVDDTPPTIGHFSCGPAKLYDTLCATGYRRGYDSATAIKMFNVANASTLSRDYPDTTNAQNVMDYSDCSSQMFTRGQVARMRASLRSDVGFRSNLVSPKNLMATGIWDTLNDAPIARPDLAPTALFSQSRFFVCADGNTNVVFTNRSYNDTVVDAKWTASNASPADGNAIGSFSTTFTTPGWSNVSLTATGNNSGANTLTVNNAVYAADPNAVNPDGYYQEFNEGQDLDKYPMFNYYNLPDHRWEAYNGAGYYDKTSVRFRNFDTRGVPTIANATGSPSGSYADMFTRAFDLSTQNTGICNLSFFTAGAFRTVRPSEMTDTLEIAASNSCGATWSIIARISGGNLGNNAFYESQFVPTYGGQWKEQSINIPAAFRDDKVFFRFRFRPGTNVPGYTGSAFGTGNHFYMDRLRVSDAPLGVQNGMIVSLGMNVSPNPTNGAATISINGGDNSTADVVVTDVTGKVVFNSSIKRTATTTRVEIPASAIAVKGMYLVKVVTNGATDTKKLVVY